MNEKKKKPVGKITLRGQQRRDAMLDVAADIFVAHGYAGATLDMIIEQSGGSRATMYKLFGGKEGLFIAVIEHILMGIFTENEEENSLDSIEAVLLDYGWRFMQRILQPQSINLYRLIIAETAVFSNIGEQFYQFGVQKTHGLLAAKLASLPSLVNTNQDDLLDVASQFLEMCKGDIFMRALCMPHYQVDFDLLKQRIAVVVDFTTQRLMT